MTSWIITQNWVLHDECSNHDPPPQRPPECAEPTPVAGGWYHGDRGCSIQHAHPLPPACTCPPRPHHCPAPWPQFISRFICLFSHKEWSFIAMGAHCWQWWAGSFGRLSFLCGTLSTSTSSPQFRRQNSPKPWAPDKGFRAQHAPCGLRRFPLHGDLAGKGRPPEGMHCVGMEGWWLVR